MVTFVRIICLVGVCSVLLGVLLVALFSFCGGKKRERLITGAAMCGLLTAWLSALAATAGLFFSPVGAVDLCSITLSSLSEHALRIELVFDRLAAPFLVVTYSLCGIASAFSRNYLHRDKGHSRFYFLVMLFSLGMTIVVLAKNIGSMYVGWEVIGLTSALLISFFHERGATRENALRAFWAYRLSDTGLLLAGLLIGLSGADHDGSGAPHLSGSALETIVPLLILFAALPKSAQLPFSAWLPRAMEGPTPSSAIFYGGLSVHAGLYLLLRSQQLALLPDWLMVPIFLVGAASAIIGTIQASVQTDIKGSLAFASMAQVGLMFVELALGYQQLVIFHFIGHSAVRTYQILSANSSLHEGRLRRRSPSGRTSALKRGLYNLGFLSSLRDGTGPHSLVSTIEQISTGLSHLESTFTALISRIVTKILRRDGVTEPSAR